MVYLAAADQKSIKNGAIISGTNVVANVSGSITNNGTISAARFVSLTAGGDIVNQAGGRIAGGTVIARAARDILAQGGSSISGGNILLSAGRDISLTATTATTSTSERKDLGKGRFTQSSSTSQTVSGAEIAATGNLVVSAGRDLTLTAAKVSAGGDASLSAGRDVSITGVTTTDTTSASSRTSKKNSSSSTTSTQTFNGTTLTSGGNLSVAAGNALTIKGSDIAAGGNATLTGTNSVSITSALENSSAESASKTKRKSATTSETASTNRLTSITAGGNLGVGSTAGNVTIAGADLSATGTTTLVGQNVTVSGVIDSATFDATSRTVKKGLLSKKVTTTTNSSTSQAVVASTVSGDRVNVVATGGDVKILGSNVVSDNGTVVQATGAITIGTLEARSSESQSVKVKKSGLSLSGAGLFAGVAKSTNASTLDTVTNTGSLVGAANGDVTVNAGKALTITGSQVAAPGTVNLIGESVRIENATDTANSTSLSKSSSFGVSIKAYENVSGAVKSVATLADRVGQGAKGRGSADQPGAGRAPSAAATGITAASETLRTVAAVTNALTNTAGVTASIGFSKSKSTTATQEQAVVGSTIAGGTVNVTATGSDINVRGSSISSTGDTNLSAARDVILESAQSTIATQSKSSSVGGGLSFTVAVGVTGIRGTPSAGISGSKSSASSNEVTQVNTNVTAGGTLNLTTGRDATLKGAVAQGQTVVASIGRDLSIESLQDTSTAKSKSIGGSLSISGKSLNGKGLADALGARDTGNSADKGSGDGTVGSAGVSGSVSFGKSNANSNIVETQSALIARGGSLSASVTGNTGLKGGVIAAVDDAGKDTAKLTLTTGKLTASDIKDSAKSKSIGIGVSASVNNPGEEGVRGADLPVVDGSFTSSTFKQDTKATIGQGTLTVGVPDSNVTINRDIEAAQVVTKDKSTGFTVYADPAAIREVIALARDDKDNSTILQGVAAIRADLDGNNETRSPLARELRELNDDLILTRKLRANDAAQDAGTISSGERTDRKLELVTGSIITRTVDAQLATLPEDERAAARETATDMVTKEFTSVEGQEKIKLLVVADDLYKAKTKVASGTALSSAERARVGVATNLSRPATQVSGPDGEIIVTGNIIAGADASLVGKGEISVVQRTGQLIRPISQIGGGAVSGTGTGLINNAKDTFGLISDGGGFLINKASGGLLYDRQAARTEGRIDGAIALGKAALDDPVATARKLGENYVAPFLKGKDQLASEDYFGGTETITEASSDLIVNAATGGSKFIAGILTGGVPSIVKSGLPDPGGLGDIEITFGKGINLQGKALEDALEASGKYGDRLHPNSKTFDFFDPATQTATSAKTLELLTDPRLRNPRQIYSTLTRYIDQAVDYTPRNPTIDVRADLIQNKAIVIAVEGGGSKAQLLQIQRAVDYARGRGLPIQIIAVKGKGQ